MTKEERDAVVELRIAKAYRAYEEAKGVVVLKYCIGRLSPTGSITQPTTPLVLC